jgi:hypothetical protein
VARAPPAGVAGFGSLDLQKQPLAQEHQPPSEPHIPAFRPGHL